MKKIISLLLALAMVMSLSVTAFAVGNGESSSTDVKATYNDGADAGKIYSGYFLAGYELHLYRC